MGHDAPWTDLGRIEGDVQRIEGRLWKIDSLEQKVRGLESDLRSDRVRREGADVKTELLERELAALRDRVAFIESHLGNPEIGDQD